ncbi:MAG: hypothetical protein ACXACG_04355 [Candidatus Thorarchaeota archaeon]
MSNSVCTRVAMIMIVVFGGVFLLLYIMFESFGITEYVWPILFPILAWTFGIMFFIFLIVGIACRAGGGITRDQTMVRRTYAQPTYPTYDSPSTGSVYVVPVYCPHCMNKLELDRVEWVGSSDLTCPSCLNVVQAGVRENL